MKDKKRTVQVIWFNGREYRRVTWSDVRVVVTYAVWEHISSSVIRGAFISRREY